MNLKEQRKAKVAAQKALLATAKADNRPFSDEEQTNFENMQSDIVKLDKMIAAEAQLEVDDNTPAEPIIYAQAKDPNKKLWKDDGEFLTAVRNAARPGASIDNRLFKNQFGLNEGVPSEGGFLVETDFASRMLKRTYDKGALASRVERIGVSANANGLTMNGVDETSRVTGSRYGGVQSYWLHEAGTKIPSMPRFRQIELKLKKLVGLCYATDELLQDTTALATIITEAFSDDFAFMVDNSIFRGNGVGQPLGITGHVATVAVPPEAGQPAGTILYDNIVNMWARMYARSRANSAWFINQDIEPALYTMSLAVGVGGVPVYLPANGASGAPYGTLFGRPVVPIEQASTLGTVGDITLADMSQYLMIDKGGMQSASSIHVRFVNDESVFRFVYRVDGMPMWNAALTPANGVNALSPFIQLATR